MLCGFGLKNRHQHSTFHGDFNHTIPFILEQLIGLINPAKRKTGTLPKQNPHLNLRTLSYMKVLI